MKDRKKIKNTSKKIKNPSWQPKIFNYKKFSNFSRFFKKFHLCSQSEFSKILFFNLWEKNRSEKDFWQEDVFPKKNQNLLPQKNFLFGMKYFSFPLFPCPLFDQENKVKNINQHEGKFEFRKSKIWSIFRLDIEKNIWNITWKVFSVVERFFWIFLAKKFFKVS